MKPGLVSRISWTLLSPTGIVISQGAVQLGLPSTTTFAASTLLRITTRFIGRPASVAATALVSAPAVVAAAAPGSALSPDSNM